MLSKHREVLDAIAEIEDPSILCDMLASDVQFARLVIQAVKASLVELKNDGEGGAEDDTRC